MSINICGHNYIINDTTYLDLSRSNLKEIPDGVFELVNLTLLNLNCNELTDIPIEINKLVKLTGLWLNNNKLTTIPYISSLVKLNCLYLVHNKLTSIPQELCEMKELERLDLHDNYIHDEESIKIFESLKVRNKHMSNQKQQSIKMLVLPMVII